MKTLDTKWMLKVAGVAVLSSFIISGCGGGSKSPAPSNPPPVEEPDPVLPPEVGEDLAQVISGSVLNSVSGSVINGAVVNFRENNDPATNIADVNGNVISSIVATDGSFEVTIKEGASIDGFEMFVSADGFIDGSRLVDVSADQPLLNISIELQPTEGVTGVAAASVDKPVANATSADEIQFDTDEGVAQAEDATDGSATITIPANTQLQDSTGQPVTGSSVSLQVVFVEETDPTVLQPDETAATVAASIPQGLNTVENVTDVSIPLAAAQVNLVTDTGAQVKKFDAPITITFNIPATTFIRSLNRRVAENDTFNVKSYDEETGVWALELDTTTGLPNKATVGAELPNGSYPASVQVDHLTFFALTDSVPACESDVNINLTGDAIPPGGLVIRLFSRDIEESGTVFAGQAISIPAAEARSLGIGANTKATVRLRDIEGNIWGTSFDQVTESSEVSVCGDVSVELTNPAPDTVDELVNAVAVCSNDETVSVPLTGALVKYRADVTKPFRVALGNGEGGYNMTGLVSGTEYTVALTATVNGAAVLASATVTADGTVDPAINVPVTCAGGTGTGGTGGSGG